MAMIAMTDSEGVLVRLSMSTVPTAQTKNDLGAATLERRPTKVKSVA
jgi:hypothetical protein